MPYNLKKFLMTLLKMTGYYRRLHKAQEEIYKIICYHRFTADEEKSTVSKKYIEEGMLKKQIEFLSKNFNICTLEDCIEIYKKKGFWPNHALSITVDDGYEDFYLYAFPILKEFRITATVFIIYDFIENQTWLWQDKIKYAFRETKLKEVISDETFGNLYIEDYDKMIKSQLKVYNQMTSLSKIQRNNLINELLIKLDVELPVKPTQEYAPLKWEQVKEMINYGINIGAHTMTHEVLTTLNEREMHDEISQSKILIEKRIGQNVNTFCYPHGITNNKVIKKVKKSGFRGAVSGIGVNHTVLDFYRLARLYTSNEDMVTFINRMYRF